jgi:hypothetical protein
LAAEFVEREFGAYVDWDERFFHCPECDDVVYECDWELHCWSMCPICEVPWEEICG